MAIELSPAQLLCFCSRVANIRGDGREGGRQGAGPRGAGLRGLRLREERSTFHPSERGHGGLGSADDGAGGGKCLNFSLSKISR